MLLADKLYSLRKERNITLQMLQLQTGISVASLSAYEKGKYAPSLENLCILARFYNMSLDEMLDVNIL
jgi:transcriptional regulator with XRE-family HTH domain